MSFVTAFDVANNREMFDLDKQPERWDAGPPFDAIDVRPGRVALIGAPPATGKTTLVLQVVTNILERHPNLRCVVGNVETSPATLIEKLLARFAVVPLDAVQDRTMTRDERARVDAAVTARAEVFRRLAFLEPPFTLAHMRDAMVKHEARLAVVDYVQRFTPDDGKDARLKLDAVMNQVRALASAGAGVLLISSVSRQKSSNGSSTYKGLTMAAFRGSAELEFGADSAYLLHNSDDGIASLECVKQRFGPMRDIPLRFCGPFQRFDAGDALDAFDAFDAAPVTPTATKARKGAS